MEGKGLRGLDEPDNVLDCGNSGTTMRLLAGLLCGQDFVSVLTGDRSLRSRPMKRIIDPLSKMNARIWSRTGGRAPIAIRGNTLKPIEYSLPVASAQVKSALIFAALMAEGTSVIEEPVITRDHTERMLSRFGAELERSGKKIAVRTGVSLIGQEIEVPGDISSAAFFMVLASILPGSKLILQRNGINPTRTGVIDALKTMTAGIVFKNVNDDIEPSADLLIEHRQLNGIDIGGNMIPRLVDELPVIAVAATQAQGKTTVSDAAELRVKETDRIRAIVTELKKMGGRIHEREDGFTVEGPSHLQGAVCESYNDHRIAMALAIAGLTARGETVIKNAECIDISFPEFIGLIREVCGDGTISISE